MRQRRGDLLLVFERIQIGVHQQQVFALLFHVIGKRGQRVVRLRSGRGARSNILVGDILVIERHDLFSYAGQLIPGRGGRDGLVMAFVFVFSPRLFNKGRLDWPFLVSVEE